MKPFFKGRLLAGKLGQGLLCRQDIQGAADLEFLLDLDIKSLFLLNTSTLVHGSVDRTLSVLHGIIVLSIMKGLLLGSVCVV